MFFYLKKDPRQEPILKVMRVFLAGCLSVAPVVLIEGILIFFIKYFAKNDFFMIIPFALAPFIEEITKFIFVKKSIASDKDFNEPVDAMMYMMVGALGFAAVENFFYLLQIAFNFKLPFILIRQESKSEEFWYTFIFRSAGATLLHALASATLGYFWAQAIIRHKISALYRGIASAGLLHLAFNCLIMLMGVYFMFPLAFFLLIIINSVSKKINRIKCEESRSM